MVEGPGGRGLKRFETVFAWTIFPLVFGGMIAGTIVQMHHGVAPETATVGPLLFTYVALLGLERVLPYHRSWRRSHGDVGVDLGHVVVSGLVTPALLRPFVVAASVAVATLLAARLGTSLWPDRLDLVSQLVLALVVGELFMYWVHRLAHEWDWLWRFHAVHHSAPRLYFLNAARFHPVDLAISSFAPMAPLIVLGVGDEVLALFAVATAVHGMFQHANLPLRCGVLNWFFSMAELHRWHHSTRLEEANSNYGQNLIVWDVVFGTRLLPADREPPEQIGLADLPGFPMDYLGQLLSPLRWRRIQANAARLRAS
jgi:sterol desaturase/sphingolipid hydroxylase (fatty acid hydroxylase superfamily)